MGSVLAPRAVIVTRATELELLIAEYGTREQARFMTGERPAWFDEAVRRDEAQRLAVANVANGIPSAWRRAHIGREDVAAFAFSPEDVVIPIGQDGLVANVAKYLDVQPVIGVNPDPANVQGALVRFTHAECTRALRAVAAQSAPIEKRTLIEARLDDGQVLSALNEIFVGHRSHQSARYRMKLRELEERQSSSGLIVASATGATGWARSISRERNLQLDLSATPLQLVMFVREAFPAPGFGTEFTNAYLNADTLEVTSEMGEGGVIFGDGIEADFLRFPWGRRVEIRTASRSLHLVTK